MAKWPLGRLIACIIDTLMLNGWYWLFVDGLLHDLNELNGLFELFSWLAFILILFWFHFNLHQLFMSINQSINQSHDVVHTNVLQPSSFINLSHCSSNSTTLSIHLFLVAFLIHLAYSTHPPTHPYSTLYSYSNHLDCFYSSKSSLKSSMQISSLNTLLLRFSLLYSSSTVCIDLIGFDMQVNLHPISSSAVFHLDLHSL